MPISTVSKGGVPISTRTITSEPTLHFPRILCLHGGGTNSRIFRAQCRILRRHLEHSFRLVFADAPYLSKPGPDVTSVYADWGPFRSWMKPQPGPANDGSGNPFSTPAHRVNNVVMPVHETEAPEVIDAIEACLAATIKADDATGATGPWSGLLGFSQGAKMAASLLLREQDRAELDGLITYHRCRQDLSSLQFAVLLAGRGPLVSLDRDVQPCFGREDEVCKPVLRLPTVHVHGIRDDGLAMHRQLKERCCVADSAIVVEWDGDHRVPIKAKDVADVVTALMSALQHSIIS